MNWKRIGRAALCLLVVCCLVLNMSPLRVQATGVELVVGTALSVAAVSVVASILIGLGVLPGSTTDTFDDLVDRCTSHLSSLGIVTNGLVDVLFLHDSDSIYTVKEGLVTAVAQWLYDSGTVTQTVSVTTSGFSGTLIGSSETYGPYSSVNYLCQTYPSELTSVIKDLGIMQKVAVFNICKSKPYYLVGLYWAEDGRLMQGIFENPLGQAHASLYGVHFTGDLALVEADLVQLHMAGSSGYTSGIFFDKSYAEAMPDFLTSRYFAVDWSYDFAYKNFGQYSSVYEMGIPVFTKESTNSVWNTSTTYLGKYSAPSKYWNSYYIRASDITWGNSSSTTIAVSDGLSQGEIALQEESLEVGYSDWYSNSKLVGIDDEEVRVFPFPYSSSISDYYTASQSDIWAGTLSGTGAGVGTDTGAVAGTLAGTAVGEFLESLVDALMTPFKWLADAVIIGIQAIFVPSEDFLTTKVDALRSRFSFADSIILTGQAIGAAISSGDNGPPVIYMHLQDAEGSVNWGGTVPALDLRWYERYKPTVDSLLSAMLWIFFAWRVFRKLPGIISGMEGDAPFEPVSDGRLGSYVSNLPRIGSTSMKRRD